MRENNPDTASLLMVIDFDMVITPLRVFMVITQYAAKLKSEENLSESTNPNRDRLTVGEKFVRTRITLLITRWFSVQGVTGAPPVYSRLPRQNYRQCT